MTTTLEKEINKVVRKDFNRLMQLEGFGVSKYFIPKFFAMRKMIDTYPYRLTDRNTIYPSTNNGFGGIISKDRDAGIKEIMSTISEVDREHGWVYIPSKSL